MRSITLVQKCSSSFIFIYIYRRRHRHHHLSIVARLPARLCVCVSRADIHVMWNHYYSLGHEECARTFQSIWNFNKSHSSIHRPMPVHQSVEPEHMTINHSFVWPKQKTRKTIKSKKRARTRPNVQTKTRNFTHDYGLMEWPIHLQTTKNDSTIVMAEHKFREHENPIWSRSRFAVDKHE